jgi:hypothetical protein
MAKKSETKAVVPAQQKTNLPTAPWRDLVRSNTAAALVRGVGASEVGSMSFRGGVITYKGEQLGHSMDVVVLDALAARHYYAGAYQPDTVTSPECYSFDGIAPHPEAQDKQSPDCANCQLNQFGSAQNAKGKACKEGYKLALINAIAVEKGKIETAEIATAKLSVTASKGFAKIAAAFAARYDGILFGAILRMEVKAHPTNQYQIEWTVVEELSPDDIEQLGARYVDAHKLLTAPYPKNEDRPAQAPKPRAGKGPVRRTKY